MSISSAKLTDKYQITIPAEVRRRLGLKAGDQVFLVLEGERVVLKSHPGGWAASSRGLGAELWHQEGGVAAVERERNSWE